MAKTYKFTVYVEDYKENGAMKWLLEIEENIFFGGTNANARAYDCGETQSYDPSDENLEGMTLQEIFEEFYE